MSKFQNWKLGIHLIFKTKRFGINNQWCGKADSIFGLNFFISLIQLLLVYPVINNWKNLKWRMGPTVGFVSRDEYRQLFK